MGRSEQQHQVRAALLTAASQSPKFSTTCMRTLACPMQPFQRIPICLFLVLSSQNPLEVWLSVLPTLKRTARNSLITSPDKCFTQAYRTKSNWIGEEGIQAQNAARPRNQLAENRDSILWKINIVICALIIAHLPSLSCISSSQLDFEAKV